MLRVSMTLANLRTTNAVEAARPTNVPTCMRMAMSHHMSPSHHSVMLSRGQMSGLMVLKMLFAAIQKIAEPAAMLPCLKCHIIGGTQRIHAGNASIGSMTACGESGASAPGIVLLSVIL